MPSRQGQPTLCKDQVVLFDERLERGLVELRDVGSCSDSREEGSADGGVLHVAAALGGAIGMKGRGEKGWGAMGRRRRRQPGGCIICTWRLWRRQLKGHLSSYLTNPTSCPRALIPAHSAKTSPSLAQSTARSNADAMQNNKHDAPHTANQPLRASPSVLGPRPFFTPSLSVSQFKPVILRPRKFVSPSARVSRPVAIRRIKTVSCAP